jgi:hypothetical protein
MEMLRAFAFLLLIFAIASSTLAQTTPNRPPKVKLISPPLATNIFSINDPIPFRVEALDEDGFVASVKFFERFAGFIGDGVPNAIGNTWEFVWRPVNGYYEVWAEATDGLFAKTPSDHVAVLVVQGAIPQINLLLVREPNSVVPVKLPIPILKPPGVTRPVSVSYFTGDGSPAGNVAAAFAGLDYDFTTGTITLASNKTSTNVTINILGNAYDEPDRQFYLYLSTVDPADSSLLFTNRFIIRILDDDDPPRLSTANLDIRMDERNRGANAALVTLKLEPPSSKQVEVGFTTANASALAGIDYNPLFSIDNFVTFQPGQSQIIITNFITGKFQPPLLIDNNLDQPDRTFLVNLSVTDTNLAILAPSQSQIHVTIVDDDEPPTVSVNDVSVTSSADSPTNVVFTVSLSGPSGFPITVNYATADGSARASADYTATQGTLRFAPGQTWTNIIIGVSPQVLNLPPKSFSVILTDLVSVLPGKLLGTGTIESGVPRPKISISDSTATARSAGTTNLVFEVRLSSPSGQPITARYSTADGTAVAGADYVASQGFLSFAPGQTTTNVAVVVNPQSLNQPTKTFLVNLTNLVEAVPGKIQGYGTIESGVPLPTITINDPSVTSRSAGQTNLLFVVSLSSPSGQTVTVNYASVDDTAKTSADYVASQGSLSFAPGQTSTNVAVLVNPQTLNQPTKSFSVKLTDLVNVAPGKVQGIGTIESGVSPPKVAINDSTVLTQSGSATNLVFVVSLSSPSGQTVTVNYATVDDTAKAGADYVGSQGALSFAPGQISTNLIVVVNPQTLNQSTKSLFVDLTNLVNAAPGKAQGSGMIESGVPRPTILINGPTVTAQSVGTTHLVFEVGLSSPSGQAITARFSTADDTARAGADYLASEGTLSLVPGQRSTNLVVVVNPQTINQPTRRLFLTLTNVANATPPSLQGTGTILPGVPPPNLSISDGTVTASSNTNTVVFTVTLSAPSGRDISVEYFTAEGSAKAGVDYVATRGTLSFAAGRTSASITVIVNSQTVNQEAKNFFVVLTNVVNATSPVIRGTGRILPPPLLSINDVALEEGNSATNAVFTVTLSAASDQPVVVDYATANGTALVNVDYLGATGTLTFNRGQTTKTISVLVHGDLLNELNETFFVNLSNPINATVARGQAQALIINDDSAPGISISDVSAIEGSGGTTTFLFPVKLSAPSGQAIKVDFATANDTALAESDYIAATGTLTFDPGDTEKTIPVVINGDLLSEATERFIVNLSKPVNATIDHGQGVGTIRDDDPLPGISINNVTVTEGDAGTSKAAFQVGLSAASGQTVWVNFATTNGTALAVSDYLPAAETLKFDASETSKTVFIQVVGDTLKEADEDFYVVLSNPVNAVLEAEKGRGLIIDNDSLPSLSINDVSVTEGDAGLVRAVFSVSLSPASGQQVTVKFATADGTATSASDYVAQTGQLIFDPDETKKPITVLVNGDTFFEGDETFAVNLSDAVNATIAKGRGQGIGTIVDDDAEPTLSIADLSILEGNAGATEAIFTVRLSAPSPKTVTVEFATAGETATPGLDYIESSGQLMFNPGETSKPISVSIKSDLLDEPDETFVVNLSKPVKASILKGQGRGTVLDDDDPPIISVNDAAVVEGNSGTRNAVFSVALSSASGLRVSVAFATRNGTATAYSDYTPNSGLLIFDPGQTEKTVAVEVLGDTLSEANEDFFLDLISPTNARLGKAQGKGTIQDDDAVPVLSINDIQVRKGLAGTAQAVFTVSLSTQSGQTVSVDFATANGTSVAGTDYEAVTGTLAFAPGESVRTITVPILSAASSRPTQAFVVNLTNPVHATLSRDKVTATIIDDRPLPGLSISDAAVTEGNSGVVNAVLTVSLSQPSGQEVSVHYRTADGTAVAGSDYEPVPNATLTFGPNETTKAISVAIKGDLDPEPEEHFFVLLSSPSNAILLDDRAVVTITDDDTTVGISITDAAVREPDTGTTNMVFTVSLSAPSSQLVTVAYATLDNTARAGDDYVSVTDVLAFAPGTTNRTIVVQVKGDTISEDDESFFIRLSDARNAVLLDNRAIGTITDNDPPPTISITDATVTEGNSGTVNANFTVTLSSATARIVSVNIETVAGTATAGKDFHPVSNTLSFLPGATSLTIPVLIIGDIEPEPVETFSVLLSQPVNAVLGNPRALGTIIDDDVLPALTITNAAVREGNAGTTFAEFTARLSTTSSQIVTVDFKTSDRTATAGSDYTATAGKLTFAAGVTTNVIRVPILGDTIKEPDETFEVRLSNPTNARLVRDVGLGTILDDDVLPTLTIIDATVIEGNSGVTIAIFAVRLSTPSAQTVSVAFQTASGTATAGSDFKPASGTLEFAPGTVDRTIVVEVIGDTIFEPDETFTVNLSNPVGAVIARGQGSGTIQNDDSAANQPPTVRIINPANGAAFIAPAEVSVTVDAFDRDGVVSKVEFFVGSTLLGSATSAPYTVPWINEAVGAYSLTARATDDKGAVAVSEPANVLVTRRVAGAEVAIIRNFADPEISLIQNYLLEMGISSQVFEQEGLSFDAIRDARLVIWNDLGSEAQGLADQEVAIFRQALDAEIPLYFIGEKLAASTRNLSASQQTLWAELIHLTPGTANRSDGTILLDELTKHPVLSGHFETVGRFNGSPNVEGKARVKEGVILLGRSGTADLIVAFEDPLSDGRIRTVTQNCRLTTETNSAGGIEQKKLFRNAVAWLMRKSFQALTDLSVTIEGPVDSVAVGSEFTYTIVVQHQGEIEGTGALVTISLGTGLKLSKSEFLQGTLTESNGTVFYNLGNMASAQRSTLSLVLLPTIGGSIATRVTVGGNEPDPNAFNNTATVETVVTGAPQTLPALRSVGFNTQGFQLNITGTGPGTYRVQASADLARWIDLTNFTGQSTPVLVIDSSASKLTPRFYRVISP